MKATGVLSIAIVLLVSGHSEQNKEQAVMKVEDRLEVSFDSVDYREQRPERTELIYEVDVLNPNLVLGISRRGVITQLENDKGEVVDIVDKGVSGPVASIRYRYEPLSYRSQFVPPTKPARWKTAIRSVLRLPAPKRILWPRTVYKLHPSRVRADCALGLLGPDCERINRAKGHLYVLMAESLEYIDVPFRPSKRWVRLTPDLEIKVVEAQSTQSGYSYRIEKRQKEPVGRPWLYPGRDMPTRMLADRQLLGRGGKPHARSEPRRLPASVGGKRFRNHGNVGIVKKIRYVIAVNPGHHKVPFELEDIPLPRR